MSSRIRVLKYCAFGFATLGTAHSYKTNGFNWNNLSIIRCSRAAATVFGIAVHYKVELFNKNLDPQSSEYLALKSKVHTEAAERLLSLCRANKGVFIKVGQHIGTLEYLVPTEYVNTMKILHSQAPASSLGEIYQVIREDLNEEPSSLFSEFSDKPLGAASLAQVHKAKLKDGRVVAVKVQHPNVVSTSTIDMKVMEVLVHLVSWFFPDFQFQWLVDESKKNIPRELDFVEEMGNTMRAKEMFAHFPWLKIPDIHKNLSTKRILTMEFVDGGQVNDIDYMVKNGIDPFDVSDKLGQLYSEMIFERGFVHSDPHPGNILVKRLPKGKAEIVLLDHGLYAHISDRVKNEYAGLWLSILEKDMDGMKKHGEALGVGKYYGLFACMVSGRSWNAITSGLKSTQYSVNEKDVFQKEVPKVLPQICHTLALVNRELLLILKTNDLLRGIEYTLKTQNRMSSYLVMTKFCVQNVYSNKLKRASDRLSKVKTFIIQQWTLFKIFVYTCYLSICSFSYSSLPLYVTYST